jgi:hypothetical protein
MLPIKFRTIFKNRWWALLWAGGILWGAADFAGGQPHGGAASNEQGNSDSADVQTAVNLLSGIK